MNIENLPALDHVIKSCENYREKDRLTTNNARRIEFITTVKVFNELFPKTARILDCAAGTGVYAFYFADRGYNVTANAFGLITTIQLKKIWKIFILKTT